MEPAYDWVYSSQQHTPEGFYRRMYYFERGVEPWGWLEDGNRWYRISCSYWFGDWIEEQNTVWWRAHGEPHRAIYIVREELMTLIKLKWL